MRIYVEWSDPDWVKFSQGLDDHDWSVLRDEFTWGIVEILEQEVCNIICLYCPDWIIDRDQFDIH